MFVGLTVFSSCLSPLQQRDRVKRRVERLVRLYALDKDTLEETRIDTVYRVDSISIPEIISDTQFIWGYKDTIISYTDAGIVTRLEFIHDTVRIKNVVLKRDTIIKYQDIVKTVIKTVPISIEPEAPKKVCRIPLIGIPCWYIWLPFILLLLFFVGRGAIKLYKEWKT